MRKAIRWLLCTLGAHSTPLRRGPMVCERCGFKDFTLGEQIDHAYRVLEHEYDRRGVMLVTGRWNA